MTRQAQEYQYGYAALITDKEVAPAMAGYKVFSLRDHAVKHVMSVFVEETRGRNPFDIRIMDKEEHPTDPLGYASFGIKWKVTDA